MFGFGKKKINVKKGVVEKKKDYIWEGRNKKNKKINGVTPALNANDMKTILLEQGITPIKIKVKSQSIFGERKKKIKQSDIALVTRQISTMLKAGVPLVKSLEIVADGVDNGLMKDMIIDIKNEVESGTPFNLSLSKHPEYFDALYCNLVAAAEKAGTLEEIFDSIALYKEKSEAVRQKIKKAMTYPIAVLVVAGIVTMILLLKVVPQFEEMFSSFGAKLPAFTQFVLDLSNSMQKNWIFIVGGITSSIFLFKECRKRYKKFNDKIETIALKIPVLGDIIKKSCIARFMRTLSTTSRSGVNLIEGLESGAGAAGNYVYTSSILKVRDEVETGQTLNFALQATTLFPSMVIQMTQIGEESGNLDEMLDKVANLYEDEVDNAVDNMTSLLEPLIMSFLGVVVGGLIIAMYLPVFKMGSAI